MAIPPRSLFFFYPFCVLVLFHIQLLPLLASAVNVSFIINSSIEISSDESDSDARPSNFLQDVLKVIADRKKWDLESIRVSKLEKARYAHFRSYEFQFPIGKRDLMLMYSEQLDSWRAFEGHVQASNFSQLVQRVSSVADLGPLEVEGPAELILLGEDRISLQLPQNATLAGLKRVLVGEGITVQITEAEEISLLHGSCSYKGRVDFSPFESSTCTRSLPIHITGRASFTASRTGSPSSPIEANFLSPQTIELNLKKCSAEYKPRYLHCPIKFLHSTIGTMEKLLRSLLGAGVRKSGMQFSTSVKTNVKASTMVKFLVQVERDVKEDDSVWAKAAEWRTKPKLELVWYEVKARLDGDRLDPLQVKIFRPFMGVDTTSSWSNMLLNVSLSDFSIYLVHPQALTLDVKW